MTASSAAGSSKQAQGSTFLSLLLAMAMFVLVVDTSLMNVSISAVVEDLNTTVSAVQGAIALEALVSAAFILINSKVGDLIGRKKAYAIGLSGYAVGAIAMTLAQTIYPVIIFWAIIGGLGAALLLPAMQALIHGNFEGKARTKTYALVGAATGIAAAVGPLLGGFITTYLSWRVGFLLEALIIAFVLINLRLVKEVPYTGPREIDGVGAVLSVVGMGGLVLSILAWQEGGESVGLLMAVGAVALYGFWRWIHRAKQAGKPTLIDPELFSSKFFRMGISGQMMQNITLGAVMIVLPIYLQMVFEYTAMQTGLTIAPFSLSIFFVSILAGRQAGKRRPSRIIQTGFAVLFLGVLLMIPLVPRADSGWYFLIPLLITGTGTGLLVSQLNNYTLSPIEKERVSEAAGVNSASGSFGLSFGLAFAGAIMLAALAFSFNRMAQASTVLTPEQQVVVADVLEEDAQIMSDTAMTAALAGQPPEIQAEILYINTESRYFALQVALLVPLLASLVGFLNGIRMVRAPDPEVLSSAEGVLGG
jgi:MFS family permease